jgi:hypothetical protein
MKKKSSNKSKKRKSISKVTTESTFPEKGIFTQDAETIARHLASENLSPKGVGSDIRMIQYFINHSGKKLPFSRKHELEKAKRILQQTARRQRKPRKK